MLTLQYLRSYIQNNIEGKRPAIDTLVAYRGALGGLDTYKTLTSETVGEWLDDVVIFVSDRPNYYFLRVSHAIRSLGLSTALVTRWGVEKEHAKYFDHVLIYDYITDLECLRYSRKCRIYVQSWVGWNFLPVYIKFATDHEVICNTNDISHILFDDQINLSLIGLTPEDISIDLLCEAYLFREFRLLTIPYVSSVLNALSSIVDNRRDNVISFPCYPCFEFFSTECRDVKSDKGEHLFYGGMIPFDAKPDTVFGDAKMHTVVPEILAQGIKLTIFNAPQTGLDQSGLESKYGYFSSLVATEPCFEFKQGLPPWQLAEHAQKFTYGFIIYDYPDDFLVSRRHYENFLPTKLFTYLEMGLPIVVINELVAAAALVKEHGLGIVVSKHDVAELSEVLASFAPLYEEFRWNVERYRDRHSMEAMVADSKLFAALSQEGAQQGEAIYV
jgi:hypothetical protein